ncbi:phosphotransferase [Catenulispora sp. NL8]|uniref:Phosphotransferase n=1 Tax=Catenulispora pinistramenti TaxID=2705254 RepID=A0ABS5KP34_9ACTN|nr:phosphotransferase [Catenulispora pinistramenti]MBS2547749.1 phosphotransferase [Catenulispora pinistramenti]
MTPTPTSAPANDPTAPSAVQQLLEAGFGLTATELDRIPVGAGSVNYRAVTEAGRLFVKAYTPGTDLDGEAGGIRLSALAAQAGIPIARPLALPDGTFIATHEGTAASVWEYVDGEIIETGYNRQQLHAVGHTLGQIHRTFATLPESSGPAPQVKPWLTFDAPEFTGTIDRLLGIIEDKDELDEFDEEARRTLRERRDQVDRIPALLAELPQLTTQVLHGDYSPMNIMLSGEQVAAVIDFRPPDPFFIAYELGRVAYYPNTVVHSDAWDADATELIAAYRDANPHVAPDGIAYSARVALLQLLTSLYGVKNHYLKPGLLQTELDAFWLSRHHAATTLLDRLSDLEKTLRA